MRQSTRTPRATALNCAVCMGYNAQAVDLLGMLPTLGERDEITKRECISLVEMGSLETDCQGSNPGSDP